MKKFLAILLCLVMVLGCLVGCAKTETKQEEAPKQEETKKEEPKKEEPKKEEKKEEPAQQEEKKDETPAWVPGQLPLVQPGEDNVITIGVQAHAMVEDYETNAATLWLEEQTGVDLQFVYFATANAEALTQLNAMVAANEKLPDILSHFTCVNDLTRNQLGEDGYIIDLRDYMENDTYWFDLAMEQLPADDQKMVWSLGTDPSNGEFYGYPSYTKDTTMDVCNSGVIINQTWLDKVGKKAPTTLEELYDVLVAFKEGGDMNGDGLDNDIPGISYYVGNKGDITEWVINAYIYCCDNGFFNVTDGKVWIPYDTEEYREALKFLNKLYAEDLLSPLSFSLSKAAEVKALTTPAEGQPLVGLVTSHPTNAFDVGSPTADNTLQYVGLAPLKDATGKGGWAPYYASQPSYTNFITTECKNPDLAFRLIDFMASQEFNLRERWGTEGVQWEKAPEGALDVYGKPAAVKVIENVYRTQNNVCWNMQHVGVAMTNSPWIGETWTDDGSASAWRSGINRTIADYWANGKRPAQTIGVLAYTAEENEELSELKKPIADYVDQSRALFVSGGLDPNSDADWQTYLDNLKTMGIDDYIAIAQTAWTRANG